MLKTLFRFLDLVAPGFAAQKAYHFMSNPRVHKLRHFEQDALARAEKGQITFNQFEIKTYTWGRPADPVAFLVHGWEGQAGNFGALIDILLDKGYQVVAFDGPSHGASSKGNTNMFEFGDLVASLVNEYSPRMIISHSFGSVTALQALIDNPELGLHQWFMITTPFDFRDRINGMRKVLGVTDRTVSRLIAKVEKDTGHKVDELNMAIMGKRVQNVKAIRIVHSRTDKVLPIEDARKVADALHGAELTELEDLGHYAILWSEELKSILKQEVDPA